MNLSQPGGEAKIEYGDSEFRVLKQGDYVTCAVTGVKIPLRDLRYWSAVRQEAYASAAASLQRHREAAAQKQGS